MPKGSWREFDDFAVKGNSENSQNLESKANMQVRVQLVKAGKGGKTVTLIKGLNLRDSEAMGLLKRLKKKCGTGGTFKGGNIELQGDKVKPSIEILDLEGFRPKQSGG